MTADIYASSNIHYSAVEFFNPAIVVQQLLCINSCSQVLVPRRRDQDCIESDAELTSYVHITRYEIAKALYYSWAAYIAAYVGTDFDNTVDYCSEIKRTNEPMRSEYVV